MTPRRLVAVFAGLLTLAAPLRAVTYSEEQVRQDLAFLYEALQRTNYDLFAYASRPAYATAYTATWNAIDKPLSGLEAYRRLQAFVALANMAHCNIGLPFQSEYVPYVMQGGTTIPFDLTFSGGQPLLWRNYSRQSGLVPGSRVVAINGRPMAEILGGIYRFLSADSEAMKRTQVELTGFPRLYWLAYGETKQFQVTLQAPGGLPREVTVSAVPAMEFEQKAAANKPVVNSSRELRFLGDTAYLRPGAFLNNEVKTDLTKQATFETGEFVGFVDAAFRDIREKRSRSLIIDLRGNPGGDNSFSDRLLAYVGDRPFRFCSRFAVRTSATTKAFWREVKDPALAELKAGILEHADGERFDVELPYAQPRPESERFAGRVFVLVDRFSYSNAVTTAAIFQDYGFGVLVGEETVDVASTYAAAHQFTLPATQFVVTYPKAWMVRPGGATLAPTVRPAHLVSDDLFTEADEVLQQALVLAGNGRE